MGQSPPGTTYNDEKQGLPFFQGTRDFGYRHPTPRVHCEEVRRVAEPGDLLFSVRAPIGRINVADRRCGIGRGLAAVRARRASDARYLEYGLRALHRSWGTLEGNGSVFGNATRRDLEETLIPWPSAQRRHSISDALGALDDKIESNGRRSEILDQMARAVFRDWFVKFGPTRAKMEGRRPYLPDEVWSLFPERLVESDSGRGPENWAVARVGDAYRLTMGQSPPGRSYNTEREGLPFLQGRSDFGARYAEPRRHCSVPLRTAVPGDTLVSVRAPIGAMNIARTQCCIGRGVAALRHASGSAAYTYYAVERLRGLLESFESTGTVFGAITKEQFESLRVLEPPSALVRAFDRRVSPMFERVRGQREEAETLASLRDRLAPGLLSGELPARG